MRSLLSPYALKSPLALNKSGGSFLGFQLKRTRDFDVMLDPPLQNAEAGVQACSESSSKSQQTETNRSDPAA